MTDDAQDTQHADRVSELRSYAALAFVVLFVAAAVWVLSSFLQNRRTLACLEEHRRDCVPLDMSEKGPPR
jgi:hypothetical protein